MSGYLLDTNAISILAPKSEKHKAQSADVSALQNWIREHDDEVYLSSVTLAEIQAGISKLARTGATRRAADLSHWLTAILELHEARTLPLTSPVALEAGRLLDRAIGSGTNPGFEDAAIAATAAVHGLTIVTENARHFERFGVPFISPRM